MKIIRNNYESFFLDYFEGNLEEDQIDQFLDFLEQNQDLKTELQLFENVSLPEEQISFAAKKNLYKSDADQYIVHKNKLVAYLEGDLENEEKLSFETYFTNHPELQSEYRQLTQTRLIPDFEIKFPNKRKLYRKTGSVLWMNWLARVAAVALLIWGINAAIKFVNQPVDQHAIMEVAELEPKPKVPAKKSEIKERTTIQQLQEKLRTETVRYVNHNKIQIKTDERMEVKHQTDIKTEEHELTALSEIKPITASMTLEINVQKLAASLPVNSVKIHKSENVMTIDEFLADRAIKAGNEGLLSVQKLARFGLGVASELSGDRIGYQMKDGKITSIGYESKLLAFSIPKKKK